MFAIGILMILGGALLAACGFLVPPSEVIKQLPPDQSEMRHQIEAQLPGQFTATMVVAGSLAAAAGVYHILLSVFVRRGGRRAIYSGITTSVLAIGLGALNALSGLSLGAAPAIFGSCFFCVIAGLFVWLIVWLFQALRNSTSTAAMAQYQAQYWQSLQQQQAFARPPAPGVPPPATIPFAPPPPPQPPSPEPTGWAYGAQTQPPPQA
jgi:hypothetical protein